MAQKDYFRQGCSKRDCLILDHSKQSKRGFFLEMNNSIVKDDEVADYFINAKTEKLLSFLDELQVALTRYSKNPSIIPPRIAAEIPSGSTVHLYMPVIDDIYSGVKTLGYNSSSHMGFVGSVNVTDAESGTLFGTLEAKELTGVRTALVSCIGLYHQFDKFVNLPIINCTVFGTGLQAFWHILCCAQIFRGKCKEFKVSVLYRSSKMDLEPFETIFDAEDTDMEISFNQIQLSNSEKVESAVSKSHIIFSCIPSAVPNLHYEHLANIPTEISHTYISLIGSYRPYMHECDKKLINKFQEQGVPIIVDSKEHTLLEAGELIDAAVEPEQLIEIGQLDGTPLPLMQCDENGRTITLCKIVGLAIMDICVAKKLLEISAFH